MGKIGKFNYSMFGKNQNLASPKTHSISYGYGPIRNFFLTYERAYL